MDNDYIVIPIDLNSKYVLQFKQEMTSAELMHIRDVVGEWVRDPLDPFLILTGTHTKLTKLTQWNGEAWVSE